VTPTQQSTADQSLALEAKIVCLHHHGTELEPGLATGCQRFSEVQNPVNAAGQFVDGSALVQGYLHRI